MKNTIFLILFLISSIGFSQNIFKKEIQLRKSNKIKETSFYIKYPKGKKYLKWKIHDILKLEILPEK